MQRLQISVPKAKIEEFCKRWQIVELSFFGSVLREDFQPDSDIDILVVFASDSSWGLLDSAKMEEELIKLFNRQVDLVTKRAIENSANWIRKKNILDSAVIYYAA